MRAEVKREIAELRAEVKREIAELRAEVKRDLQVLEQRIVIKLGSLLIVGLGAMVALSRLNIL